MADTRKKDAFFAILEQIALQVTFRDVTVKTGYSNFAPDQIDLTSNFSRNVQLKVPLVSAAMDTVTGGAMAIELAKWGGLGVIHRGFTPERQAEEVARVKYHLGALNRNPRTVHTTDTIAEIQKRRKEKGYKFHSFPVVDEDGRLEGIITRSTFKYCTDENLTVEDVMKREVVRLQDGSPVQEAIRLMRNHEIGIIPLVDKQDHVTGIYVFTDIIRVQKGQNSMMNVDANGRLRVGAAVGLLEDAQARVPLLYEQGVDVVNIDMAHSDTDKVVETLSWIKREFTLDVVVGNITEGESASRLVDAGADGIRVGQGGGSICTTRGVTGIGCPQVSAVDQCEHAIRGRGVPNCSDGGISETGHITIALAAGADTVMLGNMFAGTDEAPGEVIYYQGKRMKVYRGMGSLQAMLDSETSRERYQQRSDTHLIPEGVTGVVPYKGPVGTVIADCIGGLRKGMFDIGARTIADLHAKADFNRQTAAGYAEGRPHDVTVTEASPNFRSEEQ